MTKSATATPGVSLGQVRTVKMDGSWKKCGMRAGPQAVIPSHRMIKSHSIDNHELCKIILVRIIVTMPTHNIKRGVVLLI